MLAAKARKHPMNKIIFRSVARRHILLPIITGSLLLVFACAPSESAAQITNTKTGSNALFSNTTGEYNTADGYRALYRNTTASSNTAAGAKALYSNTTGRSNTAAGVEALYSNTTGDDNTATGVRALTWNTIGDYNTAHGYEALYNNNEGHHNTAAGTYALAINRTGNYNTAAGHYALGGNTTGNYNTAAGNEALGSNTTGSQNTATGTKALFSNGPGSHNSAAGAYALHNNTTGKYHTAGGYGALTGNTTGTSNTAAGFYALANNTTGSSNIALGYAAGVNLTTGDNNIAIGADGTAGEAGTIRIGRAGVQNRAFVQGIFGTTVANGVQVVANSAGKLGTIVSSARFKEAVQPMDEASEALLALKPVTFRYTNELDPDGIPQFGLVAEDVEKVNPDLVARDAAGQVNTVRYEAINAMLLNEFLKEHRKVEQLQAAASEQQAMIARQQEQIEALTVGLRKLGDKLERAQKKPHVAR